MVEPKQTLQEVDLILARMRQMGTATIKLSRQDTGWLLAEIDGGREAFDAVVKQKMELEKEVVKMRRTIDDLLAMRGK